MRIDPLFATMGGAGRGQVEIHFEDRAYQVPEGINVAAALLLIGARDTRHTPVTGQPRAPYCMMGVCFECLVQIDGTPSLQACLIEVRNGMRVRRQAGAAALIGPLTEIAAPSTGVPA